MGYLAKGMNRNNFRLLILITFQILLVFCFSGCVSVPSEPVTESITSTELHDHVAFLAQPALKGRKPRTSGSKLAREYINERFAALNLSPWGQAESFNQKFFIGTNIIGVLPGSDPNLADEYIILAAHYDHVGKTKDGLCLGACDNASGVAALLEIAEQLALSENKPRRSICFAAFDSEEMFTIGSFAFACRDDFDSSKIAGMVNVDMLGRAGFEVFDEHLFLVGTNSYRTLRKQIQQSNSESLQIVPIGTDIVGPRGDHIAFETMGIPALFFTCSLYKDYHQPTDTTDKLNFDNILESSRVICNTVEILANSEDRFLPQVTDEPDMEELEVVDSLLSAILQDPNAMDLRECDVNSLKSCKEMTDAYLNNKQTYTKENRIRLACNISEVVLNYESNRSRSMRVLNTPQATFFAKELMYFTMKFRANFVEAGRMAVKHLNQHEPGLLKEIPEFKYEFNELPDSHIALTELENGEYQLVYFPFNAQLRIEKDGFTDNISNYFSSVNQQIKKLFRKKKKSSDNAVHKNNIRYILSPNICLMFGTDFVLAFIEYNWIEIQGTREEIVDAILLTYRPKWTEIDNKVLEYVTAYKGPQTAKEWVEWRCQQNGWGNLKEWVKECLKSENPYVLFNIFQFIENLDEKQEFVSKIITNSQRATWLRAILMTVVYEYDKQGLLALVDTIDDKAPLEYREKPLSEDHSMKFIKEFNTISKSSINNARPTSKNVQNPPGVLGDKALERLKFLTKEDFGKDQAAWKNWIAANIK